MDEASKDAQANCNGVYPADTPSSEPYCYVLIDFGPVAYYAYAFHARIKRGDKVDVMVLRHKEHLR